MPPLPRLLAKAIGRRTAYDRVVFHGKQLDRATVDALKLVEADLDYELTITQGIGGAPASKGAHLEGRAVDLVPWDWENKMKALKQRGFVAYHREARPQVWGEHIHAVLILDSKSNDRGIAGVAFRQIGSFLRGRDGLADDGPDTTPDRVEPQPVFRWPQPARSRPARSVVTRTRDRLVRIHQYADEGVSLLGLSQDPALVAARQDFADLAERAERILKELPKR